MFSLGFSPCPNDSFIFDAIVNQKIDSDGLTFSLLTEDVEELNRKAMSGIPDITKLSFGAFAACASQYELLDSGSALGFGAGPLILAAKEIQDWQRNLPTLKIGIPGKHTSANKLFSLFFPEAINKKEYLFSDIESKILSGEADLGLVIHETRFTYSKRGLVKLADLGELWEKKTRMPLPLGGIVVKRSLPSSTKQKINSLIRRSVEFAFTNPESSQDYVRSLSQELDDEVIQKHISLYVNQFSINLGKEGKQAIRLFLSDVLNMDSEGNYFLNP